MTTPVPGQAPTAASTTEMLAATIAGAVERQLTQYVAAMSQQVDAARKAADDAKAELRAEFQQHLTALTARTEAALNGLQQALEARLGEFAQHQQVRLNEVENRMIEMPLSGGGGGGIDATELAALRDQMDSQSAAAHARIDDLHKATRRFDEQASALVQHVNDTTIALAQRMDEGNQVLASAVEERLAVVRSALESVAPEVQRQLTEQSATVTSRLDFTEHRITDRMLAMEERINEQQGARIANLEATVGRIGAGFDDAVGAMSHRLLGVENRLEEQTLLMANLQDQISRVDESAIQGVKDQLSAAVGEAMLVRIEQDRLREQFDEKMDKQSLRMAEIESLLTDEMDVSAAVQLERLEELERAIAELDPSQFVRRTDPTAGGAGAAAGARPTPNLSLPSTSLGVALPSTPGPTLAGPSTEPSLSSF
ncbi:MAG TPA: hypothetical protein DCR14_16515 [Acidimicrobiaceae bacterium]|nr:hypothetical protein [Acidimicrobiaceae bacterium]